MKLEHLSLEHYLRHAALNAGSVLRAGAFNIEEIEWKHEDDPVTAYDKAAEECIKGNIGEMADFTGEESEPTDNGRQYRFIIDPLDGTKKYIRQEFGCAVSIAAEKEGTLVGAAVYDFMRDILYLATDEMHTYYRGREVSPPPRWGKIRVMAEDLWKCEKTKGMEERLRSDPGIDSFSKSDAISLALAKLASGVQDGLINAPKPYSAWDVAAGYHMLRLQGWNVTDIDGQPFDYRNPRNGIIAVRPEYDAKVRSCIG